MRELTAVVETQLRLYQKMLQVVVVVLSKLSRSKGRESTVQACCAQPRSEIGEVLNSFARLVRLSRLE